MKQLYFIAVLLIGMIGTAQDLDKSSHLAVVTSPGSWEDGFSIGIQYEYQSKLPYVGVEVYVFPDLNNLDYSHYIGRIGINKHFGMYDNLRLYLGSRLGFIRRANKTHALLGGEIGVDVYIYRDIFIGVSGARDMKADSQAYSNDAHHMVNSGLVRIGLRF